MDKSRKTGIPRLLRAFKYSFAGLKAAWKNEEAFRQESILALFVIPAGLLLGTNGAERALLIGIYLLIPLIELINSAIESIADRIGPEQHVLAGRAKDMGSAAVLLIICIALIVWCLVAYSRFFT